MIWRQSCGRHIEAGLTSLRQPPPLLAVVEARKGGMAMLEENPVKTMARIPLREPEDMPPEQAAQYFASAHSQTNMARLMALAETMVPHLTAMNMAMATSITVPPREREIIALAVLHLERGEWEIVQHREVAEYMGIPKAMVAAIADERYSDPMFTDRERALLAFTRQVVRSVRVDDLIFNAVASFFDPRQIVETIFVIGNYMLLLRISEVVELPLEGAAGAGFWKSQQPET